MIFDVILLRHEGKKLLPNDLPAPVRGVVAIEREGLSPDGEWKIHATFKSDRSGYSRGAPHMLPPLYRCRITALDNRGLVLAGRESADDPKTAQAWWCKPIAEQPGRC